VPVRLLLLGDLQDPVCSTRNNALDVGQHNSPFAAAEAFYAPSIGIGLPYPTSDTAELIGHAADALRRIYRPGPHYAKCGVLLTELAAEGTGQADLFDTHDTARRRSLMTTLDESIRQFLQPRCRRLQHDCQSIGPAH
jgi:hypothetical protein